MIDYKINTNREQNLFIWVSTGAKDNVGQESASEASKACWPFFVPIEPFQQKKKANRERLTWCFWSG
ncbi:hypothetical protein [Eggerthella guodeyinii]|uniref:Uncharacterized protein n=1 Tax=Eggerthella guodeyinii TaxID=2690837 RepID=A0A6N7RR52_9ACTN|nr:hypothetical protein [Eggerthella guodeyinii]MRX83492.1 hypothetical protein [Eggerthella guodeyinii]